MAELLLTDEEKATEFWADLDDEALGRLVKKKISLIKDTAKELDRVTTIAAAMIVCCAAAEQGKSAITIQLGGLTQNGRDFGNWRIVASNMPAGESEELCGE